MNTRVLMLSAAVAALLAGESHAATTISTTVTTAQKTSTTGDLTIATGGVLNQKSATVPAITIDSSNSVINNGSITSVDQTTETAVLIDTTKAGLHGSFENANIVNLTGKGTGKEVLHLAAPTTTTGGVADIGIFTGNIAFDAASNVTVAGDASTGVVTDANTIQNGDLLLGGAFTMTPTSPNETSSSGVTLLSLAGTINGNVVIGPAATYTASGNAARGLILTGAINGCNTAAVANCTEIGTLENDGGLVVIGIGTRDPTKTNAESGSALVIANSIHGGILNNGPTFTGDTVGTATISSNGIFTTTAQAPTVAIVPTATAINIGIDTKDANTMAALPLDTSGTGYSFINRGNIVAAPEDPNVTSEDILIRAAAGTPVTFLGGMFNSGVISAAATNGTKGAQVAATALEIGSYVTLPKIYISGQTSTTTGNGSIAATVSGTLGGSAGAILIDGTAGTTHVPAIFIEKGASVTASATVTDPTSNLVTRLTSIAIADTSNSLGTLVNNGTISASVTTLANGSQTVVTFAHAVDVSANTTQGLNFTNTGTVKGDVLFGGGDDVYAIAGAGQTEQATQTGDVSFGAGQDTLKIGQFANVAGTVTSGSGLLKVDISGTQALLTLKNATSALTVSCLHVSGTGAFSDPCGLGVSGPGGAGTINVLVSSALASGVIKSSGQVTLDPGANLDIGFASFVPTSGNFILISAPHGQLSVSQTDIERYSAQIGDSSTLPFLFESAQVERVDNVAGNDVLEVSVVAKGRDQLGLTGNAYRLFPFVNTALAGDNDLGAAMIAGINSKQQAQSAYDAFAPDVSGGARAVAISLTDQATGVVAARQRTLRLFSKEPGDLTLWGNEFGEFFTTHGNNVAAVAGVNSPVASACNSGNPCPSSVNLTGFKDHGFGFSLGLDSGSPQGGWYGAAFTFYTGDIDGTGDRITRSNSLWYLLTGYTDWRGRGLFLDTQATVGVMDFKGKRFLNLVEPATNTTFTREADSRRNGLVGALGATAGAIFKYGETFLTPQVSLDGMSLREEGYTESGGKGFDLAVKPYYANSLRIFVGGEVRQDLNMGDFLLQPSARIGYRYDMLNDQIKLRAAFADIDPTQTGSQPGALFTLIGPDPGRGNVVAGANLNATTDNWTIGLNYDFVRGSNASTEQVGTLSLLGRI